MKPLHEWVKYKLCDIVCEYESYHNRQNLSCVTRWTYLVINFRGVAARYYALESRMDDCVLSKYLRFFQLKNRVILLCSLCNALNWPNIMTGMRKTVIVERYDKYILKIFLFLYIHPASKRSYYINAAHIMFIYVSQLLVSAIIMLSRTLVSRHTDSTSIICIDANVS